MAKKEFQFKIYEMHDNNKVLVVSGSGSDKDAIEKECQHYAFQYAQDYPIKIWRNYNDKPIL